MIRSAGQPKLSSSSATRRSASASSPQTNTVRLRKTIAFDRFLARLVAVASDRWVLKGALALDFRLGSGTRTTKDIELGRLDDEDAATNDFLAAQALDLGDFFTFAVQRTPALDAAGDLPAVRYVFRHNRRGTPMAGFQTLLGLGLAHQPITYRQIIDHAG